MTGQVHGEKNLTRAIKYKANKPGWGILAGRGVSEMLLYMSCSYYFPHVVPI